MIFVMNDRCSFSQGIRPPVIVICSSSAARMSLAAPPWPHPHLYGALLMLAIRKAFRSRCTPVFGGGGLIESCRLFGRVRVLLRLDHCVRLGTVEPATWRALPPLQVQHILQF